MSIQKLNKTGFISGKKKSLGNSLFHSFIRFTVLSVADSVLVSGSPVNHSELCKYLDYSISVFTFHSTLSHCVSVR